MREVRFRDPAGTVRVGEWTDAGIESAGRTHDPASVDVLAPTDPSKIVCVGLNYHDHAAEQDEAVPDRPLLFLKPPSAVSSHGDIVPLPSGKRRVDHEAELAVVVGEQARNVTAGEAMDHVAGFTCMNDVSNRDDQNREQNWVRGKAFDNSAVLGPVVATPDEVPEDAGVELRLNGETRQSSSRAEFVWSVPELLAEITTHLTLEPGDVVSTGTPAGVGPLSPGDEVEIEVEGVGVLRHGVSGP